MLKSLENFLLLSFFSDPKLDEKAIIESLNDSKVYEKISVFSKKLFDINKIRKKNLLRFKMIPLNYL